jgi:hypothetical protein
MGMKSGFGIRIRVPDHIYESLETIFWVKILKFFDAYPGSGMEKIRIRDPRIGTGWKKSEPGKTSRIRNTDISGVECGYEYRLCHHGKGLFSNVFFQISTFFLYQEE